jgi:hypothetical protein
LDIGLASPTGIEFGTQSQFPPQFKRALFVADWAYGRILAVHLKPRGASYTATSELFISGRPLNVTDFAFGPDGAMYLITGGRSTQSGLYRISYTGPKLDEQPKSAAELAQEIEAKAARELRRKLETFHRQPAATNTVGALELIWPNLGHTDAWIHHAARIALEHQPLQTWQARALSEKNTGIALTACLALARNGSPEIESALLDRLNNLSFSSLSETDQIRALRIYEVACARMGRPDAQMLSAIRAKLEPLYPSSTWPLNHRLCVLLVYLQSPFVVGKTLQLARDTDKAEDLMQYLFYLRYVKEGWTIAQREAWFDLLAGAERQQGARDYYSVLKRVRDDFVARLSPAEREALKPWLDGTKVVSLRLNTNSIPGQFYREWRMSDFDLTQPLRGRSFSNGKAALTKGQCLLCHRFGNEGGSIGPELTSVGSRFDRHAILESMVDPSRVIDDKYRNTMFHLKDGSSVTGLIEREDSQKVFVRENPLSESLVEVRKETIIRREPSSVSPMPLGLINILTRDEILDLLAFLGSGGNADYSAFKR